VSGVAVKLTIVAGPPEEGFEDPEQFARSGESPARTARLRLCLISFGIGCVARKVLGPRRFEKVGVSRLGTGGGLAWTILASSRGAQSARTKFVPFARTY
jgi:hypothetical protein